MNIKSIAAAAIAAAFAVAMPAQATVYSSQATFTAANPGLALVSFSGLTTSLTAIGTTYMQGGITFTGQNLYSVDTNFWGSVDSLLENRFGTTMTLTFAPSTAIGFLIAGSYNGNVITNIAAFNGSTVVATDSPLTGGVILPTQFSFWGIDGVGPITSITLSPANSGGFISVAEIQFGAAGAVPEPQSWTLMIAGFGLVGAAARRRRTAVVV